MHLHVFQDVCNPSPFAEFVISADPENRLEFYIVSICKVLLFSGIHISAKIFINFKIFENSKNVGIFELCFDFEKLHLISLTSDDPQTSGISQILQFV